MRIDVARVGLAGALVAMLVPAFGFAQSDIPQRDAFVKAKVQQVLNEKTIQDPDTGPRTVETLKMRVVGGRYDAEEFTYEHTMLGTRTDTRLDTGDAAVMERVSIADGTVRYLYRDRYRISSLSWLFAAFLVLAFMLGGRTSLMAVGGLLVSVAILMFFVIPRVLDGWDPLLTCLSGCIAIAFTSLYLAHGFSKRTSVALLSTLITLAIAAIVAVVFVHLAQLFGMGSEESQFLQLSQLQDLDLRGLLLGGMLIGCLGVLDDITTAQTAAVHEISKANPSLTMTQLQKAGFSVGKEHIASLINTLALAYAGASLPLLLLISTQSDFPMWVNLNSEFLAEEIVRTLVGSATLIVAVPISTWCAATFMRVKPGFTPVAHSHGHSHHHHHHA